MVVIPPHVPHKFHNAGDVPARALMVFRPGGFDELLDDLHHAGADGPLDDEQRHVINNKWGITFLDEDL